MRKSKARRSKVNTSSNPIKEVIQELNSLTKGTKNVSHSHLNKSEVFPDDHVTYNSTDVSNNSNLKEAMGKQFPSIKTEDSFYDTCLQHTRKDLDNFDYRIGMSNPTNLCYANALFQAILYDLFIEFKNDTSYRKGTKKCACVGCTIEKTVDIYNITTDHFTPFLYHSWVSDHRPLNSPLQAQEDVHELLNRICLSLGNSHASPEEGRYKPIVDRFHGVISTTINCTSCTSVHHRTENLLDLIVPVSSSVEQSIDSFFATESLDNYKCEKCKHLHSSTMTRKLQTLPDILCVTLQRFNADGGKNQSKVFVNSFMDLSAHTAIELGNPLAQYNLISFICHKGIDTQVGHYYTIRPSIGESFLILDDIEVSFNTITTEALTGVYLVFYELYKPLDDRTSAKVNVMTQSKGDQIKSDRFEKMKQDITTENSDSRVTEALDELLYNNTDVFHIKGDKLTSCDILEHTIPLYTDTAPVNVRPYERRSKWEKEELEKKVQELLVLDIIEPSRSPFNSPLHLVKKGKDKDGNIKSRLVVDFSRLNQVFLPETYPSEQILDLFDQIGGGSKETGGISTVWSTVDLSSSFYQIKLSKNCQHKTAFSSGYHHYSFKRMPLGLRNSSHCLNRVLRIALADLIGKILCVYLDDISVRTHGPRTLNQTTNSVRHTQKA